MKKAGILIVIVGLVLTIFTAFTVFTREKVVDIGSLKITANKPHHLNWSPLVGGCCYWSWCSPSNNGS